MKKNRKLRPWVIYTLITLITIGVLIGIQNFFTNDMNQHIERVSKKCAKQGYGIKAYYTKQGDKFYKCSAGGGFNE